MESVAPWMQPQAFLAIQLLADLRAMLLGTKCLACLAAGDTKAAADALRECASPLRLASGETFVDPPAELSPAALELQYLAAMLEQQLNQLDRAVQRWQRLISVRAELLRRPNAAADRAYAYSAWIERHRPSTAAAAGGCARFGRVALAGDVVDAWPAPARGTAQYNHGREIVVGVLTTAMLPTVLN